MGGATMIKEAYCNYEISELLKEKGFDEKVFTYYEDKVLKYGLWFEWNRSPLGHIAAPTHQMACAWLREVHKISIEITSTGYLIDGDATWDCDIKAGHRLYYQHITNEKSYESCVEAALKYVLEYLI